MNEDETRKLIETLNKIKMEVSNAFTEALFGKGSQEHLEQVILNEYEKNWSEEK